MKKNYLILLTALALVACDDDAKMNTPSKGDSGVIPPGDDGDGAIDETVDPEPDADVEPEEDAAVDPMGGGMMGGGMMGGGEPEPDASVEEDAGGDASVPQANWYECQGTDQQFVRKAIQAVLGRRPYSQAEVNLYTDLIEQVDELDNITDRSNPPGSKMHRSRKAVLQALFKNPQYNKYWEEQYRDFVRVQRVDEMFISACQSAPLNADAVGVAAHIRSKPATATFGSDFNMNDVFRGSVALDDVTPIYIANLFSMITETYTGANGVEPALEIGRRRDFGAWFDGVYLNRDVVCLGCHNSEFSVTQTNNPATNRHYPLPFLLEKSLFGDSTGPATFGGYEGADRARGVLRYRDFVNDCTRTTAQPVVNVTCPTTTELVWSCLNGVRVCDSVYQKRRARPWGWLEACGKYAQPDAVVVDIAGVEAKFGNLTGLRATMWGMTESLRNGFIKLRREGLGADMNGEVPDPDKAFAYLTVTTIVEKAWLQIVGTPLTIPTRYPRNAASRDQLKNLVDTFIASGYSNQKLLEAILVSPYANMANPNDGCGDTAYGAPALFDPWVTAEPDPAMRKNSVGDSVTSLGARTAANIMYSALKWNTPNQFPTGSANAAERTFQTETGHYLKNAEPGFRGFDFQARLGWENRFGTCTKLASTTTPDFIDELAASVSAAGVAKVSDLVIALKDRMLGRPSITDSEKLALTTFLGADLDADVSTLPSAAATLRKACGVFASSPQFMLMGISPDDGSVVPKLTPPSAGYANLCTTLKAALTGDIRIACNDDDTLSLLPR